MKLKNFYIIVFLSIILVLLITKYSINKIESIKVNNAFNCKNLEPSTPENIDDPPFYSLPFPDNVVPIKTAKEKGKKIPVEFIYNNTSWQRQAYKDYWHSSYQRWSYVPYRIHYAMHRLFATYPTASIYYDFEHNLGIRDEVKDFKPYPFKSVFDYVQIVVMNTLVKEIYAYENQLVIIGKPQRTGLQAIIVPSSNLNTTEEDKTILIQLSTSVGGEIDYTLIIIPAIDERP